MCWTRLRAPLPTLPARPHFWAPLGGTVRPILRMHHRALFSRRPLRCFHGAAARWWTSSALRISNGRGVVDSTWWKALLATSSRCLSIPTPSISSGGQRAKRGRLARIGVTIIIASHVGLAISTTSVRHTARLTTMVGWRGIARDGLGCRIR